MIRNILIVMIGATLLAGCGPTSTTSGNNTAANSPPKASDMKLPSGDVTVKNLVAFAKAKMAFTPQDQFDKGFDDTALEGRHFTFRIPISGPDKEKSSANFIYDADKEILTINMWPEPNSIHYDDGAYPTMFDYMIIYNDEVFGEPQPMSNDFGITKPVTPIYTTQIGVGSYRGDYVGAAPKSKGGDKDRTMYEVASKAIKISPTEARAATANLWVEISGSVKRPTEGHIVECGESTKKATLTYNYEEHWKQCVISSKLDRITVVSERAGILAQWPASNHQKRVGAH